MGPAPPYPFRAIDVLDSDGMCCDTRRETIAG